MTAKPGIFPYKEFPVTRYGSRGKLSSFKPMIVLPIDKKRKIPCLLDSGADSSISFKQIGEGWFKLKFSPNDLTPNKISGFHTCPDFKCSQHPHKSPVYIKPISFNFLGKDIVLNVRWIDRGFNPNEDFMFILGRDFFEYFDVLFKQKNKEVHLYP